jgi:hypothetical protein
MVSDIDADDFYSYNIYRSDYNANNFVLIQQITSYSRTSYSDPGLLPNTTYDYRIEVEDKGGKLSEPLLVRIKTTPEFAFVSELPSYIKSVTAAVAAKEIRIEQKQEGVDSSVILYFLCKGEKTEGNVIKVKAPLRYTQDGERPSLEDGFVPDDHVVDKTVQSANSYNVTKLENSLFRLAIKKYNSQLYDTMKAPLKYHIDNEHVMYRKLAYNGLAVSGDTVYIGVTLFVQLAAPPLPFQIGIQGIMVFRKHLATYVLDTMWQLDTNYTNVREDHEIPVMIYSSQGRAFYLSASSSNGSLRNLVKWNPETRVVEKVLDIQNISDLKLSFFDTENGEKIVAGIRNNLSLINLVPPEYSKSSIMSFNMFTNISAVYHDPFSRTTYVADIGRQGISVIDQNGLLVSQWTRVQRQSLDFSTDDFIMGVSGKGLFFTTENKKIWRSVQ